MPDLSPKQTSAVVALDRLSRTIGDGEGLGRPGGKRRETGGGAAQPAGPYAELQVTSNFSFLRGGSHPWELVERAAALGLAAIAVTDRNSVAGLVRAHQAARETGLRLVVGARLDLRDGTSLLAYPKDRAAYGRLTALLTLGKRRAPKGECHLDYADVAAHGAGLVVVLLPPDTVDRASLAAHCRRAARIAGDFAGRGYLAAHHLYRGDDARRLARLQRLADETGLTLLATGDVLYHVPERRPLQDVVTCIRDHCTLRQAGFRLAANAERHLKSPPQMARLFRGHEAALAASLEIVERCRFALDELRYEYPEEPVPPGMTPQSRLARLTWEGAAEKLSVGIRSHPRPDPPPPAGEAPAGMEGVPADIRERITHELALIEQLDFARYFLTVHDIVRFARSQGILCQGRGSAANSVVCYCLGITSVDPAKIDVLFERFISAARGEPPDIDVDFEHERREEVIQYIYERYGRDKAGLAATVICYRARGALRGVGKVMGLSDDVIAALAGMVWGWSNETLRDERVRQAGLDPNDRNLRMALDLAGALVGFPRHLSQHVGGFVITRGPLHELVPIENAAMQDRTVIEWDKDDLDALGILKVDILALGMLTCIRKAFALLDHHKGETHTLATVPPERPEVYDMLSKADSIGVFQVESRAQMSMLPRLRPKKFYDLVIEVAIVRPGPIQGDMVHPYLRRRNDLEKTFCPPGLEHVLNKTLGVPLFQEQAMQIAIVGAGFTPDDADRLRRAMASFRRNGDIEKFRGQFIDGMTANGYPQDFAARCFSQIEGFGTYGFPESHAASFSLLVYVSAWIKCFHPEVFACALLNAQPMGFYQPAQLVRDAREHGVTVLPVDVNRSDWDCTLEPLPPGGATVAPARRLALRLGLRQIKGFTEKDAVRLVAARGAGYPDAEALWRCSGLGRAALEHLAAADALRSIALDRRQGLWALKALGDAPLLLFAAAKPSSGREAEALLPPMPLGEHVVEDYATTSLSLKRHPLALMRGELEAEGIVTAAALAALPVERRVRVAGLVLIRQRPGSAKGVIFITLEDETGVANLIIWPPILERFRRTALGATLLCCRGRLQREEGVIHVVAEDLRDLTPRLRSLRDRTGLEEPPRSPFRLRDRVPGHAARDFYEPLIAIRSRDFH
ncbi:MAG TPA: error-prone DNA polymerase [Stellaceae bacterium]|nr:error-prone DNA polymerase [Stellaceae bacterium]